METEAMKKLSSPLPGPLAKETFDAFARYEEQREGDVEARVTKDLDKYDMILQVRFITFFLINRLKFPSLSAGIRVRGRGPVSGTLPGGFFRLDQELVPDRDR